MDGSSNSARSRAGLILSGPNGTVTKHALHFGFLTMNNEIEFEALAIGLRITRELGIRDLKARSDSQLIVGHIQGHYEARRENMMK